jgi:hypothetical protein
MRRNQRDTDLTVADQPLPDSGSKTILFPPIQVEEEPTTTDREFGVVDQSICAVVEIPALTTTQLPDGTTLTLKIFTSDAIEPDPSIGVRIATGTETVIATLVITGADGVGSPPRELSVQLAIFPPQKYIAASLTTGAGTGDQSAAFGQFRVVT